MSDPDRLAEIRQRRAAISPIPWRFDRDWGLRPIVDADDEVVVYDEGSPGDADAEFIVHTPADIDWLIGQMMHARFDAEKGRQENERLRGLLREELVSLWTDLEQAIRRAHNGQWSMECDWFLDRIKTLTQQVGAAPWGLLPITLLESGLYQRIHAELGIDAPVDMDRVAEVRAVINKSVT